MKRRRLRRRARVERDSIGVTRCVEGLRVDRLRVRALVEGSLIQATALSPYLGYDVTAALFRAFREQM